MKKKRPANRRQAGWRAARVVTARIEGLSCTEMDMAEFSYPSLEEAAGRSRSVQPPESRGEARHGGVCEWQASPTIDNFRRQPHVACVPMRMMLNDRLVSTAHARFDGTHFRRQVPIGPYVADFACLASRLIIEIDGSHHGEEPARRATTNANALARQPRAIASSVSGTMTIIAKSRRRAGRDLCGALWLSRRRTIAETQAPS